MTLAKARGQPRHTPRSKSALLPSRRNKRPRWTTCWQCFLATYREVLVWDPVQPPSILSRGLPLALAF
jgi:hypothetical protein